MVFKSNCHPSNDFHIKVGRKIADLAQQENPPILGLDISESYTDQRLRSHTFI